MAKGKETTEMVAKQDVTSRLISRFKELIAEGKLQPGSKLPPERKLAEEFGVSRPSLRQALKVLEIMGVISQRIGDGTYLNDSATEILSEPMNFLILVNQISPQELMEARLIVEPELAARAAQRATEEDLNDLREALQALKEAAGNPRKMLQADLAFHQAIFRAAGNRVCMMMFSVVHKSLLMQSQVFRSSRKATEMLNVQQVIRHHQAIYDAIQKRDPEAARQAMRAHLENASKVVLQLIAASGVGFVKRMARLAAEAEKPAAVRAKRRKTAKAAAKR